MRSAIRPTYHPPVRRGRHLRIGAAVVLAAGLAASSGCQTVPPPQEEIARFTEATQILRLSTGTQREVIETYRAWVDDVRAAEAERALDAFVSYGLLDAEVEEAFAIAVESMAGSVRADGMLRILDRAVLAGRIEAPDLMDLLRAIREASTAKCHEKTLVKGVHALAVWRFKPSDMAAYLRAQPTAKSAPNGTVETETVLLYKYMLKLRLAPKYRAMIHDRGVQAMARGMYVEDYGKFFRFLVGGRVPPAEVVEYCTFLARRANPKVELHTIAPGYDAVEDLPITASRRLALFEGVVAAAAGGAEPRDVEAAILALGKTRRDLDRQTIEAMAELILRTFAAHDSALVAEAVLTALDSKAKTGEELAEQLSLELSRVAAASRRPGR